MARKVTVLFREPKGRLALKYWPGRLDTTLPEALVWFKKRFKRSPTIIQIETLNKKVRQTIYMRAPGIEPY